MIRAKDGRKTYMIFTKKEFSKEKSFKEANKILKVKSTALKSAPAKEIAPNQFEIGTKGEHIAVFN